MGVVKVNTGPTEVSGERPWPKEGDSTKCQELVCVWTEELAPCHPPSRLYPQRRQGRVTRLSIWASIVVARKQRLVAGTGGAAGALQHGVVPLLGRGVLLERTGRRREPALSDPRESGQG